MLGERYLGPFSAAHLKFPATLGFGTAVAGARHPPAVSCALVLVVLKLACFLVVGGGEKGEREVCPELISTQRSPALVCVIT